MKAAQQDTAHEADLSAARAAGAAYADAHRLHGQAAGGAPGPALLPPRLALPDFARARRWCRGIRSRRASLLRSDRLCPVAARMGGGVADASSTREPR
jgi:hypothetical protein